MSRPPHYPEQPELALVAAFDLVTRYSSTGSPQLAAAVVAQLRCIADEARQPPALRRCAARIVGDWLRLSTPRAPAPARR